MVPKPHSDMLGIYYILNERDGDGGVDGGGGSEEAEERPEQIVCIFGNLVN